MSKKQDPNNKDESSIFSSSLNDFGHTAQKSQRKVGELVQQLNALSKEDFYKAYVQSSFHEGLGVAHAITFETARSIEIEDFEASFQLIKKTSEDAYRKSKSGWSTADKKAEMRDNDMRFLLVKEREENQSWSLAAFISFMLTVEDGTEVIYLYEIHVEPRMQCQKLGSKLLTTLENIGKAAGVNYAMLTVFTSNESGQRFYSRNRFVLYDEEPAPPKKRLRSGLNLHHRWKPSYIIMRKELG